MSLFKKVKNNFIKVLIGSIFIISQTTSFAEQIAVTVDRATRESTKVVKFTNPANTYAGAVTSAEAKNAVNLTNKTAVPITDFGPCTKTLEFLDYTGSSISGAVAIVRGGHLLAYFSDGVWRQMPANTPWTGGLGSVEPLWYIDWEGWHINSNIMCTVSGRWDIGSAEFPLKTLYADDVRVSGESIYMGGQKVLSYNPANSSLVSICAIVQQTSPTNTNTVVTVTVPTGITNNQTLVWNAGLQMFVPEDKGAFSQTTQVYCAQSGYAGTSGVSSGMVGMTGMDTQNWNTAYGWGNHATNDYLKPTATNDVLTQAKAYSDISSGTNTAIPRISVIETSKVEVVGTPTNGQVIAWNAAGGQWNPTNQSGSSGSQTTQVYCAQAGYAEVAGLTTNLSQRGATNGQLLAWDAGTSLWVATNAPQGGTASIGKWTVITSITNLNVLVGDVAKTFVMQPTADLTNFLPSVTFADVGTWYTFVKNGTNRLTIKAADADIIADSNAGARLYNSATNEYYATVTLQLANGTNWVITGAHGTWTSTTD